MAINLTTNSNYGWTIPALFDCNKNLCNNAKDSGVVIDNSVPGQYSVKVGSTIVGKVAVPGKSITMAKNHQMGPASKANFQAQFETLITKAIALAAVTGKYGPQVFPAASQGGFGVVPMSFGVAPMTSLGDLLKSKGSPPTTVDALKPAPPAGIKFPFEPATKTLGTADPVKLKQAFAVYQPVTGTSAGSTYYTFAIMDGINLAVRIKNTSFSIRAEGTNLAMHAQALKDFNMEENSGYYSGHYNVPSGNKGLIKKSLGAMISRIGFNYVKEVADASVIVGE